MQDFLSCQQALPAAQSEPAPAGATAVSVRGSITWAPGLPPTLEGVDLRVPAGALVMVVGTTGSGKSSLLSAMLGLTEAWTDMQVAVRGKVSYVAQQAYIFGGARRVASVRRAPLPDIAALGRG